MAKTNGKKNGKKKVVMNRIPNEDFITTWWNAQSAEEVAEKYHTSKGYVTVKAINLRKRGIHLKTFPKGRKAVNWKDLIAFSKKVEKESKLSARN